MKTKLPLVVIEVANSIGQFYLEKSGSNYAQAEKDIRDLNITSIDVVETRKNGEFDSVTVEITTSRPSLLIGKRGQNIGELESFIGRKIRVIEAMDNLQYHLIPQPYDLDNLDNL